MTGTITTASTNDLVCVIAKWLSTSGTVASVTAAPTSLTFSKRAQIISATGVTPANDYDVEEWCAFSSSSLVSTETITVTATGTISTNRETIFAVHGVGTGTYNTCYYDTNASMPSPSTTWKKTDTANISYVASTTNSSDLIIAYTGSAANGFVKPTGFSALVSGGTGGSNDASYEVLSSPLSSVTLTYGFSAQASPYGGEVLLIDAFQDGSTNCAGGGSFAAPPHHRGIFG